jgi:hypothetical protein
MALKPRDTRPPPIIGPSSSSGSTTQTTVPPVVKPPTAQTPVVQSNRPAPIIGAPTYAPGSAEEFTANWSKLSPEEQAKRAPGALADLRLGANKQDQILSGLVSQAQAYKKALIATGSSEEEANLIVSGLKKPGQGFQKLMPAIKKVGGGIVPDIARDVVKTVGGGLIPDVARDTVGAVGSALAGPLGVAGRTFQGVIKEIQQELDVWFTDIERGEQTYAKLPGQFREKIGPFGMFRGGPVGLESLDVPKTPTGKAGFQWGEVLKVIQDEGAGVGTTNWQNMTGNIFVDQAVGFIGDIGGDPLNLLSAGAAGPATKSVSKIAQYSPEAYKIAEAASDALKLQGKLAIKRELIKETIENSVKFPGSVPKATAEAAVAELKVVEQQLKVATKNVTSGSTPRLRGRNAAQALANNIKDQIDNLKTQLNNPNISAEQAANIRLSLEYLTPELVKDVAQKGMTGLVDATTQTLKTGKFFTDKIQKTKNVFKDVTTGAFRTTDAADVLGVSNRLRIGGYLGKNQNIGFMKEIPFTTGIVQKSGRLISGRLGAGRGLATKLFQSIDDFIPDGNGGFIPTGLSEQRAAVRAGTASASEVARNLELEQLSNTFRGRRVLLSKDVIAKLYSYGLTPRQAIPAGNLKGNWRKFVKNIAADAGYTKDDLQSVLPYITDAGARASASLTTEQSKALAAVQGFFKDTLGEIEDVSKLTGRQIGKIDDYFPQFLSDEALAFIKKKPQLANLASRKTGFSLFELKGNFLTRTLKVDDDFFGVKITDDILKKGVTELNRIANDGGWQGKFFNDDVLDVTQKYAIRHAEDMARQLTLAEAPDIAPASFARELLGPGAKVASFDPARVASGFEGFVKALKRYPELSTDLDAIVDGLKTQLEDLETYAARGTYDIPTLTILQDDALKNATVGLNLTLSKAGAKSLFDLTSKRFSSFPDILNRGFIAMDEFAPNIYAPPEVQKLFKVVKSATKSGPKERLLNFLSRELSIGKAYQLASPRFVAQNYLGNYTMMVFAARAQLKNLSQGGDIYKAIEKGIKLGKSVDEVATELAAKGVVKDAKQVVDAYALIGSSGFGRYGEVAAELGNVAKPGIRQGVAQGLPGVRNFDKGVTKKISEVIGGVPQAVRGVAGDLEQRQRFQFMWDGVQQGLTPQEAVTRVQYYLFDYEDISKFDRFAKQLVPYYMWLSRNTPRQLTIMALEPRPYILAEKLKNATEKEDTTNPDSPNFSPVTPYEAQRGVYRREESQGFGKLFNKLGFGKVDLGLPLIGFGEESPSKYLESPLQAFAGPLRPELRLPIELAANQIIGLGGAPIAKYTDVDPTAAKVEYAIRSLGFAQPLALAKRYIGALPPARANETIQKIFDIGADENEPGQQALAAVLRIIGFVLTPSPRTNQLIGQVGQGTYNAKTELENQQKKLENDALREYQQRQTQP